MLDELGRYGGPWAAPLAITAADTDTEITAMGSGLRRTRVVGGVADLDTLWIATDVDAGLYVRRIGIAALNDGPFLLVVNVGQQTPLNPEGRVEIHPGDELHLRGPLTITFS